MSSHVRRCALAASALLVLHTAPFARSASASCDQALLFNAATTSATPASPSRLALADFDHDGILDLVVACSLSGQVVVMRGQGSGGVGNGAFDAPVTVFTGMAPYAVAAGDLDGDGKPDLVINDWQADSITILRGNGDGTFTPRATMATGSRPWGIGVGDLDGDGHLDVVIADNGTPSIEVFRGLGDGTLAAPISYPIADLGLTVLVADVDGDGKLDVVATAYQHGICVLHGNGDGTLAPAVDYSTTGIPTGLNSRDLNGDGHPDLVVGFQPPDGAAVMTGLPGGTFAAPIRYGPSGYGGGVVLLSDLDGDGILDLIASNPTFNNVVVLKGNGTAGQGDGSFALQGTYAVGSFPVGMAAADLNGDGYFDLAVTNFQSASVSVLMGGCSAPPPPPGPPYLVSVSDVPNDQGGRVFLRWLRSAFDTAGAGTTITGYRVWRRIPPLAAAARSGEVGTAPTATIRAIPRGAGGASAQVDFWEAIATLPAEQLAGYGYTAATTQDSMANSNPYTAFFVTALTASSTLFYESNVDSGYSVDNIPPETPVNFVGSSSSSATYLRWSTNPDPDVADYRLYRGSSATFVPGPGNLVMIQPDTAYTDQGGAGSYYKLSAVDTHGNESGFALLAPSGTNAVGPGAPRELALALASANPARGGVSLRYSLPQAGRVRLTLYDLAGREVRLLVDGDMPAGVYTAVWNAQNAAGRASPGGVYLALLTGAGREITRRFVLLE